MMAPEFVDRQIRLWSSMGGPQARFSVTAKWGAFRDYRGTDESAATLAGLHFAALMGDLDDGPPHPETVAALSVMARLGKSVDVSVVLEHVDEAMRLCREGLKAIPKKHRRPAK